MQQLPANAVSPLLKETINKKKCKKKSSVALPLHLSNLPTFPSRLQRHSFKGLDTKGFTIGRLDLEASA
jgi:hypothetical protein